MAIAQAGLIAEALLKEHELDISLLSLTTEGDRRLDSQLRDIGGKGVFVRELQRALLDGRADLAVHSVKDYPAKSPDGLMILAVGAREDRRDAWVSGQGNLYRIAPGSRIGTSSRRRALQLLALRPDLAVVPVRGNLDTRLQRLEQGDFAALILACAGLRRLGLEQRITAPLPTSVMLPACGQGALGVELRAEDDRVLGLLRSLVNRDTALELTAERALAAALGADCHSALGVSAEQSGHRMRLCARICSEQRAITAEQSGEVVEPLAADALAQQLAQDLLSRGAGPLLADQTTERG